MEALTESLKEKIDLDVKLADQCVEKKDYDSAIAHYMNALNQFPVHFQQWEEAVPILFKIGDFRYQSGEIEKSIRAYTKIIFCPNNDRNFLVRYKLGDIDFERHEYRNALDSFLRAFKYGGEEIFNDKPEYLKFLKANIDISNISEANMIDNFPEDREINFDLNHESDFDITLNPEEIFTPPVYELSEVIHEKIKVLSTQGDQLVEGGDIDAGIDVYRQALNLVPEEKAEFEAATWLYTAIGDAYFILNDFEQSLEEFILAEQSCNGATNPFINLRLGQCYFELKNNSKAKDHFVRVYLIEMDKKIFEGEDNKYLKFLDKCLK